VTVPQPATPAGSAGGGTVTETETNCSTDYDCEFGQRCVKPPGRYDGKCMQVVNKFGNPTYKAPSGGFGPGKRECRWRTDCPIGFQCEDGHCIK
jgi:hypothetical protein